MHILLLTTSFPRPNDWSRAAFNLQLCLALTAEHTVSIISPLPWHERLRAPRGERWPEWSAQLHVQYPTFYYPPGVCRWSYALLMRMAARTAARNVATSGRPDVVLGYWSFPDGAVASHIAREYRVPHVQMVGGSDVLLPRSGSREARRVAAVLTGADHVVAVGRHIRERVLALGVSPARVSIVPRGVDTRVFSPGSKTHARRRLGIPEKGVVLLWAGRLHAVKGLDV